jgi:Carboxypeptidase regulatory-like domain
MPGGQVHLKTFATVVSGILISISSFSQTSTGRIAGSVTDQSGAAITGAVVTVVDERTNQERTTSSNDDGNFAFTGLETV